MALTYFLCLTYLHAYGLEHIWYDPSMKARMIAVCIQQRSWFLQAKKNGEATEANIHLSVINLNVFALFPCGIVGFSKEKR